jgi:hypothetical protein
LTGAQRSRPGLATTTASDSIESLNDSSLPAIKPQAPKRLSLSATADAWITDRAHDLAIGQLGLWDLPVSMVEFYYVAYFAGRDSLGSELTRARRDADRYYGLAFNPPPAINHSAKTFAELEATRAAIYGGASV